MPETVTKRRLPRAEREARMLAAAEAIFTDRGFGGASMEEIALESGITKALLYQYFRSKEGLYVACVERSRKDLFDRMEAAAAVAPDAGARLRELTRIYLDDLIELRGKPVLLYGDAPVAVVDQMRTRNAEAIARILRIDFPAADDDSLAMAAHMVVGAGEQLGRWWTGHPEVPVETVQPRFMTMVGGALGGLAGS